MKILTAHEAWLITTLHIARKERAQIARNWISSIFKSFIILYIILAIAIMAWIGFNFTPDISQPCSEHFSKPVAERIMHWLK